MAEPIGALRVDVAANVAQITEDMGKIKAVVSSSAAQMARGMETFGKGVSKSIGEIFNLRNALIVTAAAGLVAFVKKAVDAGDEIAKTAQKIGISTDKLQELRYAAANSGVKIEDFDNAMLQLSRRLGESGDQVTEVAKALGRLGLSMADVKGKDAAEVFAMVADRISRIPDPMDRARIATDLFGKSGQQLLPVLMSGSKGLAALADEAHKLGLVIDKDTLKKAEEANDEFTKMSVALKAAGVNIAVGFLPALRDLRAIMTAPDFQEGVRELAKNFGEFIKWMVENKGTILTIAGAFSGMRVGAAAGSVFGKKGAVIGGAIGGLSGGLAGSFMADNNEVLAKIHDIEKENTVLESQLKATALRIANAPDQTTIGALATQADQLKAKLADNKLALAQLRKEGEQNQPPSAKVTVNGGSPIPFMPEAEKAMQDLAFQTRIMKGDFDALAEGFPALAHGIKIFGTDTYGAFSQAVTSVKELPPQLKELNQKMLELKGAQLTKEMLEPWEQYALAIARVQQLLDAGVISADTYNRKIQSIKFPNLSKLADDAGDLNKQLDKAATDISGGIGDAFTDMVTGAKNAGDAMRDLEKAVIRSLVNMVAQMVIVYPIASLLRSILGFGGGFSIGSPPAFGIGHAAMGGSFGRGDWSVVGERGPELVRFGAPAEVIPNHKLGDNGGGGRQVIVNIEKGPGTDVAASGRSDGRADIVDIVAEATFAKLATDRGQKAMRGAYNIQPVVRHR